MAFVVKKSKMKFDKKSAYTWGACGIVLILVVAIIASLSGGPQNSQASMGDLRSRSYDLASMQFTSDMAEQELLAKAQYEDIKNNPVTSTLYSEADKEARQEADAAGDYFEALPPDEEYAEAAAELAAESSYSDYGRGSSYSPTVINPLSVGGGSSFGGGGGGFGSGTYSGYGGAGYSGSGKGGKGGTSGDANAMKRLRNSNTGLAQAYAQSRDAAKKDGEAALAGAGDAFQGGKGAGEVESLMDAEEGALGELNPEEIGKGNVTGPTASNLDKKVDDAKKKTDKKTDNQVDFCKKKPLAGECVWASLFNMATRIGESVISNAASSALKFNSNAYDSCQRKADRKTAKGKTYSVESCLKAAGVDVHDEKK
ncbi:hypothetical protein Dip518_000039 [Parelusimicrobium proximum]|uniref:hypothetical protein n=1 Tax=Parelusimicrobium proximum TaxID=3228953 RepID=UPI003D176D43